MGYYYEYYRSPIGTIKIEASDLGIVYVGFVDDYADSTVSIESAKDMKTAANRHLRECINQLKEYFAGQRKQFKLKLHITGTDFRKKVWNELLKIPYGSTCSYIDIARNIGNVKAVRAIGGANHNNNIIIIIPCHRVIGKNGDLIGYGAGLWRKKWLLEHEKKFNKIFYY